ncbi:hypothetical protein BRIN106911_24535 [Brevibacillus invocatus]
MNFSIAWRRVGIIFCMVVRVDMLRMIFDDIIAKMDEQIRIKRSNPVFKVYYGGDNMCVSGIQINYS